MSDLISRSEYKSKLVKALDVLNKEYREALLNEDNDLILAIQNQQSAYMIALRLLDNEPTAYDIDKVIEELEKQKSGLTEWAEDEAFKLAIHKAIEIVKQGGVSDYVCEWESDYGFVSDKYKRETGCGYTFYDLHHAVPFKYCPYCGKKIKVVEQNDN